MNTKHDIVYRLTHDDTEAPGPGQAPPRRRYLHRAPTGGGWGISITRWTTYRNAIRFEVHRVSPEFLMLRLNHFGDEKAARTFANTMWRHDR